MLERFRSLLLWPMARADDLLGTPWLAIVLVLLVDLWEKRERVAAAVQQRRYALRVLLDADGEVSKAYHVRATPTVFLIGQDGSLLGEAIGPKPWTQPEGRAPPSALLK